MPACAFDTTGYGPHHGDVAESSGDEGSTPPSDDDDAPPSDAGGSDDGGDDRGDDRGETSAANGSGTMTGDAPPGEGEDGSAIDDGAPSSTGRDDDSSSGGIEEPACPQDMLALFWANEATVGAPMQLVPTDANMAPEAAASVVAESGTVTFDVEFACPGEYTIWGLVWDYAPGAYGTDDPDSFYVGVGGPEQTWRYGCQTGEVASGLSWQPLLALQAQPCEAAPLVLDVAEAGSVQLQFRNREEGGGNAVAGIAAIVVASDGAADPTELYAPYE